MEIEGSTLTPEEMGYFHKTIGPDEVLIADDTYPQTPLGLKVYGNTRQNLWVNPSGSGAGVTVTPNADGSFTLSGTSTKVGASVAKSADAFTLKPSTTYTLSVSPTPPCSFAVQFNSGTITGFSVHPDSAKTTFTSPDAITSVWMLVYLSTSNTEVGQTFSGTYRVMLNEGSEAQPWCPPGLNSVESLEIVTAGKNLAAGGKTTIGSTNVRLAYAEGIRLNPGSYRLSCDVKGRVLSQITVFDKSESRNVAYKYNANELSFTIDRPRTVYMDFYRIEELSIDDVTNIQLELGSTATEYEPPNVNTVPIDLQGNELHGFSNGVRDALDTGTGEISAYTRIKKLDGTEDWRDYQSNGRTGLFGFGVKGLYITPQVPMCNTYAVYDQNGGTVSSGYPDHMCGVDQIGNLWIKDPRYTSLSDFKAYLKTAGVEFLVRDVEPKTYEITPPELPALPAPNLTAYADADVACDMELEYVYDPYYGYSDLLHGMSWLRVDYDGDDVSENYSSRVDLGGNRLFALSDELKDELDVISGKIRKRTMYGVLVGTESWSEKTDSTGSQHEAYYQMDIAGGSFSPGSDEQGGLFGRLQTKDPKSNDGSCAYCFADSTGIHIRMRPLASAVAGLDGFKDWLSQNHVPYVRYLFEGEEDLSITPVNLPELYDPDVTVGISFG